MPVTTFSRFFPAGHPNAGKKTFFVEQILTSIYGPDFDFHFDDYLRKLNPDVPEKLLDELRESLDPEQDGIKMHTIRKGDKCRACNKYSFRVWSGRPYMSRQIVIVPEVEIVRVANIHITGDRSIEIGGGFFGIMDEPYGSRKMLTELAKNDGLAPSDFTEWFKPNLPFTGQIRFWKDCDMPY